MPIELSKKPIEIDIEGRPVEQLREEDIKMRWQAREFIQYDRNPAWMSVIYLVAALILIYAIWTMNFLFAVLIVLAVITIYVFTQRKPKLLDMAIMKKGFKIDNLLYTFDDDLENFWILYNPPDLKTLYFKRKQSFFPQLIIQLEDQNPMKVRDLLLKSLPEDVEQDESLVDKFSRKIGF